MKMYFQSRGAARAIKSGKLVDNGQEAANDKRWERYILRSTGSMLDSAAKREYAVGANGCPVPVQVKKSKI